LVAPGLTGHSGSGYLRSVVIEGAQKGYKVGVMHGRGIGGTPLKVGS
jgi:predicted alpha/beta-fold hydrolase